MIMFLIIAIIIKLISIIVPFQTPDYRITNIVKSANNSLIIIFIEFIISILFVLICYLSRSRSFLELLFIQILFDLLLISIVIVSVYHKKESINSIGMTKVNLLKSIIVGAFIGIIILVIAYKSNISFINILTYNSIVSLFKFTVVGITEEIIFRGYLQIRLIVWKGTRKALFLTAIIFSFFHFPIALFESYDVKVALLECINLIPFSLILGYIMIKMKNIITTSILHIVWNWIQIL